jgi:hypothetical protein
LRLKQQDSADLVVGCELSQSAPRGCEQRWLVSRTTWRAPTGFSTSSPWGRGGDKGVEAASIFGSIFFFFFALINFLFLPFSFLPFLAFPPFWNLK